MAVRRETGVEAGHTTPVGEIALGSIHAMLEFVHQKVRHRQQTVGG